MSGRACLIALVCASAATPRAAGQVEEVWMTRFGTTVPAREGGRSVVVDRSGSIYAGGWSEPSELSGPQGVLVKYDPTGGELWTERIEEGEVVKVALDGAGNLYAGGILGRQQGIFIRKYEPAGRLLWSVSREGKAMVAGLAVSAAGEAHLAGTRRDVDDVFLTLKLDPAGNKLWESEYDGPCTGSPDDSFNDLATAITLDASGNCYVAGTSRADDSRWEYAIVKYGPGGDTLWARRHPGSDWPEWSYDTPRAIAVDPQENVVVTGRGAARQGVDGYPDYDFVTVKYDSRGNLLWTAGYEGPDGLGDDANDLAIDPAGNILIAGKSASTTHPGAVATVKLDRDGKTLWAVREEFRWSFPPRLALSGDGKVLLAVSADAARFAVFRYGPGGERLGEVYHEAPGLQELNQAVLDPSGNLIAVANAGGWRLERLALFSAAPDGSLHWTASHVGAGLGREQPVALAPDGRGNLYLGGWSSVPSTGTDFAAVKLDTLGRTLWSAGWAGPGSGFDRPAGVAVDASGGLVVAGYSSDARAGKDYLTLRYSPEGDRLWEARYDSAGGIWGDSATGVAVDPAGNVYVTGGSDGGTTDVVTIKYSPLGEELWLSRFDVPAGWIQAALAIALDGEGGIFLTGYAFEASGRDYHDQMLTLKLDGEGNPLWADRYGRGPGDNLAGALVLDRGSAIVLGLSKDEGGKDDYAVLKYSTGGSLEWAAHFDGPAGGDDRPAAIAVDAGGNVYVTGTSEQDFATLKYSPDGALLWSSVRDGPFAWNDRATALAVDPAGAVYVAGISSTPDDLHEYRVLRYSSDGALLWEHGREGLPPGLWGPLPVLTLAAPGEVVVAGAIRDDANASDFLVYKLLDLSPDGAPRFIRGDASGDGVVDVSDASRVLSYLFLGAGAPECLDAADSNDDGGIDLSDPLMVLRWLFLAGDPPPPPRGVPGPDLTPDVLACARRP